MFWIELLEGSVKTKSINRNYWLVVQITDILQIYIQNNCIYVIMIDTIYFVVISQS